MIPSTGAARRTSADIETDKANASDSASPMDKPEGNIEAIEERGRDYRQGIKDYLKEAEVQRDASGMRPSP